MVYDWFGQERHYVATPVIAVQLIRQHIGHGQTFGVLLLPSTFNIQHNVQPMTIGHSIQQLIVLLYKLSHIIMIIIIPKPTQNLIRTTQLIQKWHRSLFAYETPLHAAVPADRIWQRLWERDALGFHTSGV